MLGVAAALGACGGGGGSSTGGGGMESCEMGETEACTCAAGGPGTRSCREEGFFGLCACDDIDDAGVVIVCDVFDADCPDGMTCAPDGTSGSNGPSGVCAAPGTGTLGMSSTLDGCAAGLIGVRDACRTLCDPADSAGNGCAGAAECEALDGSNVGGCELACDVTTDPTTCPPGDACRPTSATAAEGVCRPWGSTPMGGACTVDGDCGVNAMCDENTCKRFCEDDDDCASGSTCADTDRFGASADFMACRIECSLDRDIACTGDDTCVAAFLLGQASDGCRDITVIAPGALCDGLSEGDICAPRARCSDGSAFGAPSGVRCHDTCDSSRGAFGTTNHPDCRSASATCTETAPGFTLGFCL